MGELVGMAEIISMGSSLFRDARQQERCEEQSRKKQRVNDIYNIVTSWKYDRCSVVNIWIGEDRLNRFSYVCLVLVQHLVLLNYFVLLHLFHFSIFTCCVLLTYFPNGIIGKQRDNHTHIMDICD